MQRQTQYIERSCFALLFVLPFLWRLTRSFAPPRTWKDWISSVSIHLKSDSIAWLVAPNFAHSVVYDSWPIVEYLLYGPDTISKLYRKCNKQPFRIPMLRNSLFIVSSDAQLHELTSAPDTILSLHAVAKDMFQPKHTMHGFPVHDASPLNGSVHSRVLRNQLTSKLPDLQELMRDLVVNTLSQEVSNHMKSGAAEHSFADVPLFAMSKRMVSKINSLCFVGIELAYNDEYTEAAMSYAQEVAITGEMLQFFPESLAPVISWLCTNGKRAEKAILKYVEPLIEQQLKSLAHDMPAGLPTGTCLYWIVDFLARKETCTTTSVVQEFLALWFGSVHQLSMSFTYALCNILDDPEVVLALREELEVNPGWWNALDQLHLLDSFIKESLRLHPSDSITMRRKAVETYEFMDGTKIPRGDWVCAPLRDTLHDPALYPSSDRFNAYRFHPTHGCPKSKASAGGPMTDLRQTFPMWGLGKHACPGRFYASKALKLMVACVLEGYDLGLDEASHRTKRSFSWRSAIIPRSSARIRMRPRFCS